MGRLRIVGAALIIAGVVGLALSMLQNSGGLRDLWGECTPSDGGYFCTSRDWVRNNPTAANFLWYFLGFGLLWGPFVLLGGIALLSWKGTPQVS